MFASNVELNVKPHEFRELVNTLRDTARQHHAHDSLRERISGVLRRGLRFDDHVRLVSYAPDGMTCTLNINGVEHYYDLRTKSDSTESFND